jgi:pimeloyl-ACP methyl ester carboxylesterase
VSPARWKRRARARDSGRLRAARRLLFGRRMSIIKTLSMAAVAIIAVAKASSPRAAEACTLPAKTVHKFWPPAGSIQSTSDKRCTYLGGTLTCRHYGSLYTPPGGGAGKPAIVFLHPGGRTQYQNDNCETVRYFVDRGYVVFSPYARGVGDGTYSSTGTYAKDYADNTPDNGIETWALLAAGISNPTHADHVSLRMIEYFEDEARDVGAAIDWLLTRNAPNSLAKLVDPDEVAVFGNAWGGARAIQVAQADLTNPPKVAIDMSGATGMWDRVWEAFFPGIAAQHEMSIRFFQTSNESAAGLDPTQLLFFAANGVGTGKVEWSTYSDVPGCESSSDPLDCAHDEFLRDGAQVDRWAPDLLDYLYRHSIEPIDLLEDVPGDCELPSGAEVKQYWPTAADPAPGNDGDRCTGPYCSLKGYLFTPPGGGEDLPAIVWQHGSGSSRNLAGGYCEIINDIVDQGYVLFLPNARGVLDTTTWTGPAPAGAGFFNSGLHLDNVPGTDSSTPCTWTERMRLQFFYGMNVTWGTDPAEEQLYCRNLRITDYMIRETDDLSMAMKLVASLPATDGTGKLVGPIALAGHSYGGIKTVLASGQDLAFQPDAFVGMSGGATSWDAGTAAWEAILGSWAEQHTAPLWVLSIANETEAQDGRNVIGPFEHASSSPIESRMSLYSEAQSCVGNSSEAQCAHNEFLAEEDQIRRWAGLLVNFLDAAGVQ